MYYVCIYTSVNTVHTAELLLGNQKLLNVSLCVEKESSLQHSYKHAVIHYLGSLNSFHQVPFRSLHYPFQFYIPFQENALQKYCSSPGRWIHRFRKRSYLITFMCSCSSLCIYLLTPRCRVLLEELTGLQLVKKFPAFHGTRSCITALTNVRHLSLSWASPVQSVYPHPTSWSSIRILSTHLRLGLPSGTH